MPYETFSAVDFAVDESFRRWVKSPTPESDAFWRAFAEQHPNQRAALVEARLLVNRLKVNAETPTPERLQRLWDRIQQEVHTKPAELRPNRSRVVVFQPTPLVRWAAVWGGLLLLAGLAYWQFSRSEPTRYTTAYGETRTLKLPDGSVVTLNGHSTLTLSGDWTGDADRDVLLTGEAFFAVTKRKNSAGRPVKFRVRTADLRIDVLGTRFNVSHHRNRTEVVLQEGRVQVSDRLTAARPLVIHPGEMITYSPANRRLTKAAVDPRLFTSWRDKLLIFREQPVGDIANELADRYGIRSEFRNPSVAAKRFSGSVPTDSVAQFFTKLQKVYGVGVRRENQRYIID